MLSAVCLTHPAPTSWCTLGPPLSSITPSFTFPSTPPPRSCPAAAAEPERAGPLPPPTALSASEVPWVPPQPLLWLPGSLLGLPHSFPQRLGYQQGLAEAGGRDWTRHSRQELDAWTQPSSGRSSLGTSGTASPAASPADLPLLPGTECLGQSLWRDTGPYLLGHPCGFWELQRQLDWGHPKLGKLFTPEASGRGSRTQHSTSSFLF